MRITSFQICNANRQQIDGAVYNPAPYITPEPLRRAVAWHFLLNSDSGAEIRRGKRGQAQELGLP